MSLVKSRHKRDPLKKQNSIETDGAALFYVQTVIDAAADCPAIRIFFFSSWGRLILLTVGVHPETYATALALLPQCVRQSGIKRQWRAPDL